MKTLKQYLEKAEKEHFAVPQFNFSDLTQLKAIAEKCAELKSPAIVGTSEGEAKWFGLQEAVAVKNALVKKYNVPLFLNLDHGKSFEYLKEAVDAGYDMVHFDGSKLPVEENIKIAKEVVKYAKKKKVVVEGEIGKMGTDSSKLYTDKFTIDDQNLTNPDDCPNFLKQTGVDLLAISIGTFHGIEASGINPNLRLDLLAKIKEQTKNIGLVLHGGSGTPEDDIKESIKLGIVKININTELRIAFNGNLRRFLTANPEEIVPYKFMTDAKEAVKRTVDYKIKLFGSEGKV